MESPENTTTTTTKDDSPSATVVPASPLWSMLHSLADSVFTPCKPPSLLLPFNWAWGDHYLFRRHVSTTVVVIGTILYTRSQKNITLCFQNPNFSEPFFLLDLPITTAELLEAGRVTLECGSGPGQLLAARRWAVYCCGRRVGYGYRRSERTEGERWGMEAIRAVSGGTGELPEPPSGGGKVKYLRSRFERVVGSADCESFHVADPTVWVGQELSFFFLRV